jgi:hypothetical protein
VVGEGEAPDGEGVRGGQRLRSGARGGDDQRGVVLHANLANGGPVFDGEGAGDPGDHVLILCGVEVDPAKGVGGLLGGEGRGKAGPRAKRRSEKKRRTAWFRYSRVALGHGSSCGRSRLTRRASAFTSPRWTLTCTFRRCWKGSSDRNDGWPRAWESWAAKLRAPRRRGRHERTAVWAAGRRK